MRLRHSCSLSRMVGVSTQFRVPGLVLRSAVLLAVALKAAASLRTAVLGCGRVAVLTGGLQPTVGDRRPGPASDVHSAWHGIEVAGPDAAAVATEVVEIKARRDRPVGQFVSVAMRGGLAPIHVQPPVAVALAHRPSPIPAASVCLLYEAPEYVDVLDVPRHLCILRYVELMFYLAISIAQGRGVCNCFEQIGGTEYRCYEAIWMVKQQWTLQGGLVS